jgi:hypothetical protein
MLCLHVPLRPSRDHPAHPPFAVGRRDITCYATPSRPAAVSTDVLVYPGRWGFTRSRSDIGVTLAALGCVGLRGEWVCVAARVCTCTCTCEYPSGICMRRSGATRGVALSRDAGSDVTGRMPRGCGTGGRGKDSGGTVQGVHCDHHEHESCYPWHLRDGNCTAEGMSWKKNDSVHSLRQPPCMHKGNYI